MNPDTRWKQRFDNLDRACGLLHEVVARGVDELSPLEKEGAIHRFEYTFELAWKTLLDYMEEAGIRVVPVAPRHVLKEAFAAGIIKDGKLWIDMLDQRNLLTHRYDSAVFDTSLPVIAARYYPALEDLRRWFAERLTE
ncbi:MAG: nucleotidyltransferase substrate binding protein [Candidatus Sumerlaeia bacterium]|nr:nucleotidyltransferase substrate binding protein [Candidatus Sumerlaeia bacterium]